MTETNLAILKRAFKSAEAAHESAQAAERATRAAQTAAMVAHQRACNDTVIAKRRMDLAKSRLVQETLR